MTTTTRSRPVYAIPTGPDFVGNAVRLGTATSRTSAIAQARAAGFRVMTKGGTIGLTPKCTITASDSDDSVWGVTVYA